MKDIVYIAGLTVETVIGVYEHERDIRQKLIVDLELHCDTRAAGASDDFRDALDCDAISSRGSDFIKASSYQLIEAVAENTAALLLREFSVQSLKIKVSKPGAVSIADDVGVIIERHV